MADCNLVRWALTAAAVACAGCAAPGSTDAARTFAASPTAPAALGGGPTGLLQNAPFNGHDSGPFEFVETGCATGLSPVRSHTNGTATLLGAYSWETRECFDGNTGTFSGGFTITAANGDTVVGTYVGSVTDLLNEVTAAYAFTATISGGTGRFAGVTGSFSGTGQANLATLSQAQSFSGTISAAPKGHS